MEGSFNLNKDVLLMFSGGKDSFLSACGLIEQGYKLKLITYNSGFVIQSLKPDDASNRLIQKYGTERVESLGTHFIPGLVREFFLPYFNMTMTELFREYGDITISQLNCLICRTIMYIYSIRMCRDLNISILAEGARKSQLFVIELEGMVERYRSLLLQYNIDYLLPVYDLVSDVDRGNELLRKGFIPSTNEDQCLLGVPLGQPVTNNVIKGVHAFFDKAILPRIQERNLIEKPLYKDVDGAYRNIIKLY